MSAPVFLAEPGSLTGYAPGSVYVLAGAEGRHAAVVQRRHAGERVDVVDGAGVRLVGTVEAASPEGLRVLVADRVDEPRPEVALVLVQALAKGDRDEQAIEAATEIGVDGVLPWQAERSIVVWRADRAAKGLARWQGIVRAGAKQSRRAHVPAVEPVVDHRGLAARVRAVVGAGGVALVLHEEASVPLAQVSLPSPVARPMAGLSAGDPSIAPREVLVVVGPEGGISDRELATLTGAGAQVVRLGPHVLRTSTAGPVALALLAERLGRWT
ncbi:16S rRNA (uracil(1498)-N(3))-methyltransferase [Pengzhenrongella frigida]|uniref:Ribosomal RNA small subunit methyltransferase E n=1 Tax=Pengzhenrongella frigida TaxID=1259133 RepID=A0A4V1ZHM5_9MICO|nr:16S rRNA (uracil(1498)-N(3))-methyltransferase [Cellulomonas sp. HLT2-17]RYV52564.1 16S rRNA (uracil(1498)-N(3))-methyltransferase [Cellulomonas sp. HLT2-17]